MATVESVRGPVELSDLGQTLMHEPMVTDFFVPVLIGNVIGGTALFALIAYAQVMKEI